MIYVPVLKTRQEELRVAKALNECFSDNIVPLFEIIDDIHQRRYKVDPLTGDFIYKQFPKQKRKVRAEPTDADIITMDKINDIIGDRTAFIDYFRYTIKKYGRNIDVKKVELARRLNDDVNLYKERLKEIYLFNNLIPVVSIKASFFMPKNELKEFLIELKNINDRIALRITEEFIEIYQDILENVLEDTDFFLFDIEEQCPKTKFMELDEISEMDIDAKIVLLNSPRKAKTKNGDYPENNYTDLIDNCAKDKISEYNLDGYGDYCGLKDILPTTTKGNGTGAALALMYDYGENSFWAYTNKDTSLGPRGYKSLIPQIVSDKFKFDPDDDCEGYRKILEIPNSGNWSTWHNICLRRYISQIHKNIS